nr:MAG: ORF1 [TTV-like mini virus]
MARYYYRRRWKPRWRKRYRWFRPWRTRGPFRRRRRPKRRVRRKLPFIHLKQYQPKYIHRLTVKGLFCLLQVHKTRYNHDYNQYYNTTPKEGLPNGGGFSIVRFNLNTLFEEHTKARNYWTKSNRNMPLFRYTGCRLKIYRPRDIDLVLKTQLCYPMSSTKLMFTGCQPSMLMMNKGSYKIRCLKNTKNKKPYKILKLRPPEQMSNKWYFQHTESKTGLLMMQIAAASFDQYYTSINAESSSITLHGLNLRIFQNMNFANPPTSGYIPKQGFALYASNGDDKIKDLIWLGQTNLYNKGKHISEISQQSTWKATVQKYMEDSKNWGNPFHHTNLYQSHTLWIGQNNPLHQLAKDNLTANSTMQQAGLTKLTQELILKIRYNPFKDKGNNNIYILPIYEDNYIEETNKYDLEPPADIDLQNPGFPNWLSCFGFQDYLIKLNKKPNINTKFVIIWKSPYFEPLETYYLLMDDYFLNANSEELIGRTDWDNQHWHPQIQHQQGALNLLALCGPGTPKLGEIKLAEAKMEYNFYFKVGGCAPPVEKITDPTTQPTWVTPTNISTTNSLQSPDEPIETFLYQFDWRRDQITESAAQRITKDYGTKTTLFTDAVSTGTEVPLLQTLQEKDLTSEEEETKEETLFDQLQRHRIKQRDLRQRIRLLLTQLQTLE